MTTRVASALSTLAAFAAASCGYPDFQFGPSGTSGTGGDGGSPPDGPIIPCPISDEECAAGHVCCWDPAGDSVCAASALDCNGSQSPIFCAQQSDCFQGFICC